MATICRRLLVCVIYVHRTAYDARCRKLYLDVPLDSQCISVIWIVDGDDWQPILRHTHIDASNATTTGQQQRWHARETEGNRTHMVTHVCTTVQSTTPHRCMPRATTVPSHTAASLSSSRYTTMNRATHTSIVYHHMRVYAAYIWRVVHRRCCAAELRAADIVIGSAADC